VLNVGKTATEKQLKITEFEVASVQGGCTKNVHFMQTNALRQSTSQFKTPEVTSAVQAMFYLKHVLCFG